MVSGCITVEDKMLFDHLRLVADTERIFLEPSAAAGVQGLFDVCGAPEMDRYLKIHGLYARREQITHIVWATGGRLVPENVRKEHLSTYL